MAVDIEMVVVQCSSFCMQFGNLYVCSEDSFQLNIYLQQQN